MFESIEPLVTVLMPVYNGEEYLHEAIESILNQTYCNFELLIINDGSTDHSVKIIESFHDPRIRLEHNETNLKIAATLNKGIGLAKGKYIARMDCDDISFPTRIEQQVAFMEQNPDFGICAGNISIQGNWSTSLESLAFGPDEVRIRLLFYCCLAHPTIMMRKETFEKHNLLYRPVHAEDYDLWVRAAKKIKIHKLEDPVLYYRNHGEQLTQTNAEGIRNSNDLVIRRQLEFLGITPSNNKIQLHKSIGERISTSRLRRPLIPYHQVTETFDWLEYLNEQNNKTQVYNKEAFDLFINNLKVDLSDFLVKIKEIRPQSTHKKIYLFGCGRIGKTYLDFFEHEGIQVTGFLDNSSKKWGGFNEGIPIYNPLILSEEKAPFLVIVTSVYANEIHTQLENMGLKLNVHFKEPLY